MKIRHSFDHTIVLSDTLDSSNTANRPSLIEFLFLEFLQPNRNHRQQLPIGHRRIDEPIHSAQTKKKWGNSMNHIVFHESFWWIVFTYFARQITVKITTWVYIFHASGNTQCKTNFRYCTQCDIRRKQLFQWTTVYVFSQRM